MEDVSKTRKDVSTGDKSRRRSSRAKTSITPAGNEEIPGRSDTNRSNRKTEQGSKVQSVRIRMYRQGLGDCFLVTFYCDQHTFHMLIDCGVFKGTPQAAELMADVAESIRDETGGHLHLVVATHEHWDHLSGFLQARHIFDSISMDTVWMAWTEDPGNLLARRLRENREKSVGFLRRSLSSFPETASFGEYRLALEGILDFFGDPPLDSPGATSGNSTREGFDYLCKRTDAKVHYCYPGGQHLALEGVGGIRVYVLGPPQDETKLARDRPSTKDSEVYEFYRPSLNDAFFAATRRDLALREGRDEPEDEMEKLSFPFDSQFRLSKEMAQNEEFFRLHYGFDSNCDDAWRTIDNDWLAAAGELALQLDSDTNNTSLVLAIELVETGKVLLFPADAQVGNWLSWHDYTWQVEDRKGQAQTVTAEQLLGRAVFYKVAHHGSHNATLRERGLELMSTNKDLVAMIPVDQEVVQRRRWKMPFSPLLKALQRRTRGRIIIAHQGLPLRENLDELTESEWKEFEQATKCTDLYIDYTLQA